MLTRLLARWRSARTAPDAEPSGTPTPRPRPYPADIRTPDRAVRGPASRPPGGNPTADGPALAAYARVGLTLVAEQLTRLETLEAGTDDDATLQGLFDLDHRATRQRRLLETQLVLLGEAVPRRWREPLPLNDVVRAAVGEARDFGRPRPGPVQPATLDGAAAAEVIHLLAELIDDGLDAAPDQPVDLRGEWVGTGYAVEVEDHRAEVTARELDARNAYLKTGGATVRPDDGPGILVVSRIARRHGVTVQWRRAPAGGVTAVVVLPTDLVGAPGGDSGEDTGAQPHLLGVRISGRDDPTGH
ncbi:ATP-binding protein [Actinocatenispora rupis]|uniref:histidine kinase n=1 Tax=Actinocatenispora rupis TaxID=519421 RepID=A0A8J3IZ69_9ACTN|nr:ATP-binding protein [Actinocatenispora rupis]GID11520.1 hypothetical protein Aru02nite_24090 [Actinocatenispora rupis]